MKRTHKVQSLIAALEPVVLEHGFELVDIEMGGTMRMPIVRVFIDKIDGIVIDEIVAANAWIGACLDEFDPTSGSYTLEVSSPGIDRPLRTLKHFEHFVGETVRIVTKPQEQSKNRAKWTGMLKGVEGTTVVIEIEDEIYRLEYTDIKKAYVKGTIDFNRKVQ